MPLEIQENNDKEKEEVQVYLLKKITNSEAILGIKLLKIHLSLGSKEKN